MALAVPLTLGWFSDLPISQKSAELCAGERYGGQAVLSNLLPPASYVRAASALMVGKGCCVAPSRIVVTVCLNHTPLPYTGQANHFISTLWQQRVQGIFSTPTL
jgi:hypothetical protein